MRVVNSSIQPTRLLTVLQRKVDIMKYAELKIALFFLIVMAGAPVVAQEAKAPADSAIISAIETEYQLDDVVNLNNINVACKDGIVTLTGTSDNLLSKERAARIAGIITGVRGVINRIEIAEVNVLDTDLRKRVETALQLDPATELYEVDVSAQDGVITLSGAVTSWQEKQLCQSVAKNVGGVKEVENNLAITYNGERPDAQIREEIKGRLGRDVRIDDFLVNVAVDNAEVRLSGAVASLAEKNRAFSDAWVAGVTSVDATELEVEWWARESMRRKETYVSQNDSSIEKAVLQAFRYDPRVNPFDIWVSVDNGSLTLQGDVSNAAARQAAQQDAQNVVGVWRVINLLKTRPQKIPPDQDLVSAVRERLANDVYVNWLDIRVNVRNGTVYLSGDVHTSFEKYRAARITRRIKGVVDVVNNIDYRYTWQRRPDWEIRENVKNQLYWSPFVDQEQVQVNVDDGIVTLSGVAATRSEYQAAVENAFDGGARDVINELEITHDVYGPYYWYYRHRQDNTGVELQLAPPWPYY
ncbi:MAG: BON domain-containing protein [Chitinivibrionales bacterium]|nr:BON domain-containing protein [Chitinivibrionales bacterium]